MTSSEKHVVFFLKVSPSCSRHIVQVGCQVLLQQTVHNSLEHGDEKGIAGIALKDTKKETESRRKEQEIKQLYLSAMHWYAWFLLYIYYSNTCVLKASVCDLILLAGRGNRRE